MSLVLLIDPDWQHKDKELPEKFIVKIVSQLVMQQIAAEMCEESKTANPFGSPEVKAGLEAQQKRVLNL
ncbi:hypothetical protein OESDEN_15893 [Oesophagostomum dentatum]|uniref:Uncharacterized protein n=1 Tax=Oesophagostomum dentatum TaxID=61180 RepID=A0A0B1SME3_OESDE|nr:hypothetical protein OESDEN_15893 [Oesophagostomum dentatum]